MECLKELGTSIYLRWKPEHLAKRLMLTDLIERPVLQGKTEEELLTCILPQLEAREPFYAQADIVVDVPLGELSETNDEQIAEYLCQLIKSKTR